ARGSPGGRSPGHRQRVARARSYPRLHSPTLARMSISNWNINVIDDGTTLLVMPAGELDIHTAPDLTAALERCTDEHRVVIVDVSDLTFVDSTGLKVLVSARNRARDR